MLIIQPSNHGSDCPTPEKYRYKTLRTEFETLGCQIVRLEYIVLRDSCALTLCCIFSHYQKEKYHQSCWFVHGLNNVSLSEDTVTLESTSYCICQIPITMMSQPHLSLSLCPVVKKRSLEPQLQASQSMLNSMILEEDKTSLFVWKDCKVSATTVKNKKKKKRKPDVSSQSYIWSSHWIYHELFSIRVF